MKKNAKHKKKIAAIEKRYPVFGILEPSVTGKLKAYLIHENAAGAISARHLKGSGRGHENADLMKFFDEIDQNFSAEDID